MSIRIAILTTLLQLPDRQRALNLLRQLAASDDPSAGGAVMALLQAARPDGVYGENTPASRAAADAILRDLYERNLVKHGTMNSVMSGTYLITTYGLRKGWVRR